MGIDEETGIKITTLAIREKLMDYFKDGCIDKMVEYSQVSMKPDRGRVRYHFERDTEQIKNRTRVLIGDAPIMGLEKEPEKVVIYSSVLNRSPQFRQIQENIEFFLQKYLPGIDVEVQRGKVT